MKFLVLNLLITILRLLQFIGCVWMFSEINDEAYLWAGFAFGLIFIAEMTTLFLRLVATVCLVGALMT